MRELKSITHPEPAMITSRRRQLPVYWRIAETKAITSMKRQNYLIESYFHELIAIAKDYLATLPDEYSRTFVEKDYKLDPHQSLWMHTFFTSCLKFDLHCYPTKQYHIHYDFYYCPFEAELKHAIEQRFSHMVNYCTKWKVNGDCEEYFKRMLFHYDSEDINSLEFAPSLIT